MTDATGVPTNPDLIPTYNTSVDAPSGLGFNTAMAQLQAIITNLKAGTLASGKLAAASIVPSGTNGQVLTTVAGVSAWAASAGKTTTSLFSGGPPGAPADGDIWIATAVDTGNITTTNGTRWAFQYNATSGSASKWEFIGGAPLKFDAAPGAFSGFTQIGATGWFYWNNAAFKFTATRAGDYLLHVNPQVNGGTAGQYSNAWGNVTAVVAPIGNSRKDFSVNGSGNQFGTWPSEVVATAAANDVLAPVQGTGTGAGPQWASAFMTVTPVRIT